MAHMQRRTTGSTLPTLRASGWPRYYWASWCCHLNPDPNPNPSANVIPMCVFSDPRTPDSNQSQPSSFPSPKPHSVTMPLARSPGNEPTQVLWDIPLTFLPSIFSPAAMAHHVGAACWKWPLGWRGSPGGERRVRSAPSTRVGPPGRSARSRRLRRRCKAGPRSRNSSLPNHRWVRRSSKALAWQRHS